MIWKSLALVSVLAVAACTAAAPPPDRAIDFGPAAEVDDRWSPPVARPHAEPAPGVPGEPMALAKLVETRLQTALNAEDQQLIDAAANRALNTADAGDAVEWDNPATGHHGEIILASRDAVGDGRICAILHHTHVFKDKTIRGSLTVCRRDGEPWMLDDARWLRTGDDLVQVPPADLDVQVMTNV